MTGTIILSLEAYEGLKQQASRRREDVDKAVERRLKFAVSEKTVELQREIHKLLEENIELRGIRRKCTYAENQLELMRRRGLLARIFNHPVRCPEMR